MMGHILIFMYMIALFIGTWAAFYTHQMYKLYRLDLLRHFLNYTIFFNLSLFVYQISEYVFFNLLGSESTNLPPNVRVILSLIGFMVEFGMAYSLVNASLRLLGRESFRRIDHGFIAAISLFGISFVIGMTLFIQTGSDEWIMMTYRVLVIAAILSMCSALIVTTLCRRLGHTVMKKKAIRAFGGLYLLKYNLTFAVFLLPSSVRLYAVAVILILSNFIPIIWLKQFFVKYFVDIDSSRTESILEMLSREYRISKREREIIELILKGKSNKEIEDILCISFSTVKNHIYNVYQKMGINSRGQLMHLVMEFPKNQNA
jgi:DNA-binding CsgD family transcriptional regulator